MEESKNVQATPTRTYCKRNRIVGRPDTGSLPRTIAPADHPRNIRLMKNHFVGTNHSLYESCNGYKMCMLSLVLINAKLSFNHIYISIGISVNMF